MMIEKLNSENRKTKILAVLIFWFLFFIIEIFKKGLLGNFDSARFFGYYIPGIIIWIVLTFPTFFAFSKTQNSRLLLRISAFVILGISVGTIKTLITWTLSSFIQYGGFSFSIMMKRLTAFYFVEAWVTCWILLILFFIKEIYDRYKNERIRSANLENQLTKAELHSLKMRLQPHFLFNAHNNIAMLVRREKNDEAVEMISRLSDLLRLSLDHDDKSLVSVREEIEFTKLYLDVESLRFEDTLKVLYSIDQDTKKIAVPNMILQPVVENSIKHGISQHLGNSALEISSFCSNGTLVLQVKNTGPALSEDFNLAEDCGHGLEITKERLINQYGESSEMSLFNWDDGVICEIKIPMNE